MDTILNYLDNMFISFEKTPEVKRAKEDLAEMMEDKYNELLAEGKKENEAIGIVISEFGNIQELADELGISSSSKAFDEMSNETRKNTVHLDKKNVKEKQEDFKKEADQKKSESELRYISMIEVEEYLFAVKQSAMKFAAGVFLCIFSPSLLLLLEGIKDYIWELPDEIVEGIGVSVLLIMLAAAVGLFISAGIKLESYEYLKKECFQIDELLMQKIFNIRDAQKGKFTLKITLGVVMCIMAVVPVLAASWIFDYLYSNDFFMVAAIVIMLGIIGIAVSLFITAGMEDESYKVVLQEKDFSIEKKSRHKISDIISHVYWPVILFIYLAWSFYSENWGFTWIIWPIAAFWYWILQEIIEVTVKVKVDQKKKV